jgi:predicted DNA-binding protein (MmcQ/YjbR family)
MLTTVDIRRLALALPEADEAPHFDATAFRVRKKIFCTLGADSGAITVKLDPDDQHNLAEGHPGRISPVEGYWGRNGWTVVQLGDLEEALAVAILRMSWARVAPKRLATAYP